MNFMWNSLLQSVGPLVVGAAVIGSGLVGCDFKTTDGDIDRGIELVEAGDRQAALAAFDVAAATLPESPELNFDRGVAFAGVGITDKALEHLLRALETKKPELRQKVYAALGAIEVQRALKLEADNPVEPGADPNEEAMKAWKQAVSYLEDALVLDGTDLASRQNLEVALIRVDPPCSTRDDAMEENDSAGTARLIELTGEGEGLQDLMKFQEQLFSCPDDDDWYRIDAQPGDRIAAKLTIAEGAEGAEGAKDAEGAKSGKGLTLQLLNAANRVVAEGVDAEFTVPMDAPPGPLFVAIRNTELDEVSYSLGVELRPACGRVEDRFESNDLPDEAKQVTPGPVPDIKMCPANDDWFALVLAEGESVFLYAEPADTKDEKDKAKGEGAEGAAPAGSPLVLDVFRAFDAEGLPILPMPDDEPLVRAGQMGKARIATLLTPGEGRYLFRVRGADAAYEGRYALRVEIVPPCPDGDDRFEDNDIPEAATDFAEASAPEGADPAALEAAAAGGTNLSLPTEGAGQQGPPVVFARICPGDVDWWRVEDDPAEKMPAIIGLTFDHSQGDLAMALYDETGVTQLLESDTSQPDVSGEVLVLPREEAPAGAPKASPAGDDAPPAPPAPNRPFLLKIFGKEGSENFYLLRLDRPSPQGDSGDQGDPEDKDDKSEEDQESKPKDEGDKGEDKKPADDKGDKPQADKGEKPRPLEDALDNLDKNPENLEARDSARKSPLAGQKPIKDW